MDFFVSDKARFFGSKVSRNQKTIMRRLNKAIVAAARADAGNTVNVAFGNISSKKPGPIFANNPPVGGPAINPRPTPAPISPIPLARSFSFVMSAIAADATEIFPPIIPVITLEKTKREKLPENNQIV